MPSPRMSSPQEQFALLAALHQTEKELEDARGAFIATLPIQDAETKRLKLLLLQQKIGRCLRDSPSEVPKLLEEQKQLLKEVNDHELRTRAKLLEASHSKEAREALFRELVSSLSLVPPGGKNSAQPGFAASTSYCPKGHLLTEFVTPAPKFACDRCANRFPQGTTLYSCRACDFDLCPSCFEGNPQLTPVRPNLDFASIATATVLTLPTGGGGGLNKFTSNSRGFLITLAASAFFNPGMVAPEFQPLAQACLATFNPNTVAGKVLLNGLVHLCSPEAARYALASANDGGEAILRLILAELPSGQTKEDQDSGLRQKTFEQSPFYYVVSLNQIQRMGELDNTLKEQDWFGEALLRRLLPTPDELDPSSFQHAASLDDKLRVLEQLKSLSAYLRPNRSYPVFDYLIMHHYVKLDRERRKPLLPGSISGNGARSETNVPLLLQYLSIKSQVMNTLERRGWSHNEWRSDRLCQAVQTLFPFPSVAEDLDMVAAELFDIFSWQDATVQTFDSILEAQFVRRIFNDATNASAPLTGTPPSIKFCDFNARTFSSATPLTLYCDLNGVRGPVSVKLFEIDTKQLYRKTKREISTAIVLDGLVPHFEKGIPMKVAGARFAREKITLLDNRSCSGCFVVEIVADGVASRVVVRKGAVRCLERLEAFGRVFFPIDLDANPRRVMDASSQKIELWVDGKVYYPEAEGETRIVVPYDVPDGSASNPTVTAVLTCSDSTGSRSHIFTFRRASPSLILTCSYFVDRETLLNGNRAAQLIVKPSLFLSDIPVSLSLLKDYKLSLTSVDADGITTEETFEIDKEELRQDIHKTFRVIPKLASVSCSLRAVTVKEGDVVYSRDNMHIGGINGQASTGLTYAAFLRPNGDGGSFELLLLGRSGEPIPDVSLNISFTVQHSSTPIVWNCRTNARGAVDLGLLRDVTEVQCATKAGSELNVAARFRVPADSITLQSVSGPARALEIDPVQFICPLKQTVTGLSRSQFALVQLSEAGLVVRDCFGNLALSPSGIHVYVRGLSRGNYRFSLLEIATTVDVHIMVVAGRKLMAQHPSPGLLRLPEVDGRAFIADPREITHPLAIHSVQVRHDRTVRIRVAGGSTNKRRVHVLARHFMRRIDANIVMARGLGECLKSSAGRVSGPPEFLVPSRALYVEQRKLGDEIVYSMNRSGEMKHVGNMLPMASQLLNTQDLGETQTRVFEANEGTKIQDVQDQVQSFRAAPMAMAFCAAPPPSAAPIARGGFGGMPSKIARNRAAPNHGVVTLADEDPNLDFLIRPSALLVNLVPDPQEGLVEFELNVDAAQTWLEIVATDSDGAVASKVVYLPNFTRMPDNAPFLDLRHRLKFPLDSHVVETQSTAILPEGSKFEIGSLATAKFAVLDSFGSFFDFALAMRPNLKSILQPFEFLKRWPKMSEAEKLVKYSANVCHELNFVLKQRDPDFFMRVIHKQLREKPESVRVILDHILLDEDLTPFCNLHVVQKMTSMEQALLCVAVAGKNQAFAMLVLRLLEDAAAYAEEQPLTQKLRAAAFLTATQLAVSRDATNTFFEVQANAQENFVMDSFGNSAASFERGVISMKMMAPQASSASLFGSAGDKLEKARNVRAEKDSRGVADDHDADESEGEDAVEIDADYDDAQQQDEVSRVNKSQARQVYKDLGPAHAWTEKQFLQSQFVSSEMNASFWLAFARHRIGHSEIDQGSFIHRDFCLASDTSPSEVLIMLGAIDAPFNVEPVHRYDARRDAGELDFYPSCDCLVFHQQIHATPSIGVESNSQTVLLGQSLFAYDASQVLEDREPIQILAHKPYISRVVVTNVSNETIKVKLLVQIPEGSLPLCSLHGTPGVASETVELELQPFTTVKHFSTTFYFPHPGTEFAWFPAHVSRSFASSEETALLAFATPRRLNVVHTATIMDETSWSHICSESATIDQVCAFIENRTLRNKVDLRKICWRFVQGEGKGKSDWERIRLSLERRGIFAVEVDIFALVHELDPSRAMALASKAIWSTDALRKNVGPQFSCPLLQYDADSVVNATSEKLETASNIVEVFPLVNNRAHPFVSAFYSPGREDPSPNVKVTQIHHQLIRGLCFQSRPLNQELRTRLAILLLTEGEVSTAKKVFFAGGNLAQYEQQHRMGGIRTTLQMDYLSMYLGFFLDESDVASPDYSRKVSTIAKSALNLASQYSEHPNIKWRERFNRLARLCKDLLGETRAGEQQMEEEETGSGAEKRLKQSHQEMASRAPSFEIELDGALGIKILTSNFAPGAEFSLNVYKMNVEHLFSTKPFSVSQDASGHRDLGQFAFVLPNFKSTVVLPAGKTDVVWHLPQEFANDNLTIQVTCEAQQRVLSRFASSMRVNIIENFGILRVSKMSEANEVVPLAYCKVYVKLQSSNKAVFYKDGYTDVKGEFDYSSVNTTRISDVAQFSVFISHPKLGSVIRRVDPPLLS